MNELSQIADFYNRQAEECAKEWYPNNSILPNLKDFLSLLPKAPSVLDLGCGTGHESKRLHSLGASVTGIDISKDSIRIASAKNPNLSFFVGDFSKIDQTIGSYDGVLAAASLIHVPSDKMKNIIKKIGSILKKNGILCIIIRDGHGYINFFPVVENIKYTRTIHLYTRKDITEHCRLNGFKYIKESVIVNTLATSGWKCYLFQKNK
jgi:2-polyprenyl-3-methyl-5-hydroxy-6-metoxy-1,4-benzoquinol methylase